MSRFSSVFLLSLGCVIAPLTPAAAEPLELSGHVLVTSEYVTRGISRSDDAPAIEAAAMLTHTSGLYAGLAATTINITAGDDAEVEVRPSAGYRLAQGPWSADIRYTHFGYPGSVAAFGYRYDEVSLQTRYALGNGVTLGALVAYSPNYFLDSGDAEYIQLSAAAPVAAVSGLGVSAALGKQYIESAAALADPVDWRIGADYSLDRFGLPHSLIGLDYTDTNLGKGTCADGCEAKLVATIKQSF